jgi:catechol 2,3-dioxygenase-like lactoylglutathione lyase family enzyme
MQKPILYTVAILLLSMATSLKAQSNMEFTIDHYAINVSDLNLSVKFYQDVFDLKAIKNGTGLSHIRWFRLGKSAELHIIQVDNLDKKLPKGVHLALAVSDFNRFRESLKTQNIAYSDWPGKAHAVSVRPDGIQQIYFQDPDGYWIEVNDAANN